MKTYFLSPISATRALEKAIDRGFAYRGAVSKDWDRNEPQRTTWHVACATREGHQFTLLTH